jgi:hypothetical protein
MFSTAFSTLPPRGPAAMKNGGIDLLDHGFMRLVESAARYHQQGSLPAPARKIATAGSEL